MVARRIRDRARAGTPVAVVEVRGMQSSRKEVGTMGYMVIGIAYIVLAVIAAVKPRADHA